MSLSTTERFEYHMKDIHPESTIRQCKPDGVIVENARSKDMLMLAEDMGLSNATQLDDNTILFEADN